jgi:hypothetical protein
MTMPAKKPAKKINPSTQARMFGILNHIGDIWTYPTFVTAESAEEYLALRRADWPSDGLQDHKVVPVRVTITPIIERRSSKAGKAKP